jgi:hypothetical protein
VIGRRREFANRISYGPDPAFLVISASAVAIGLAAVYLGRRRLVGRDESKGGMRKRGPEGGA